MSDEHPVVAEMNDPGAAEAADDLPEVRALLGAPGQYMTTERRSRILAAVRRAVAERTERLMAMIQRVIDYEELTVQEYENKYEDPARTLAVLCKAALEQPGA